MSGIKHDNGKPEPRLVLGTMARAILAVSEIATFGAKKYSADNWLFVDDSISRYTDAKDRHRLQGAYEALDKESGMLHAAHEAWNALAVLELKLRAIEKHSQSAAKPPSEWKANDRLLYIGDTCDAFNYGKGYYIERIADSEMISSCVVIQAEGDVFVRSNKGHRSIRFPATDVLQSFEFIA